MLRFYWTIGLVITVTTVLGEDKANQQSGGDFLSSRGGGLFLVAENEAVRREIGLDRVAAINVQRIAGQYRLEAFALVDRNTRRLRTQFELKDQSQEDQKKQSKEALNKLDVDMKTVNEKYVARLTAALTAEQFERLRQITWQAYSSQALSHDPELAKALGVKNEQIEAMAAIFAEHERNSPKFRVASATSQETVSSKLQNLIRERDDKMLALLTTEQKETLTKLKGKPFDLALLTSPPPRQQLNGDSSGVAAEAGNCGIFSIVGYVAVQKELELSHDVVNKIKEIRHQFNTAWHKAGGGFRTQSTQVRTLIGSVQLVTQEAVMPPLGVGSVPGQSENEHDQKIAKLMEVWKSTTAKFLQQLIVVLTPRQYTRLQQIHWQARGAAAYSDADVIEALAISGEQQDRISSIADNFRVKRQELTGQSVGNGDGDLREKLSELTKDQWQQINSSLTEAQREKFAAMKGHEFDLTQLFDEDERRSGGFGRGN